MISTTSIFKRLELSGFKSFAKAARFDFDAPIVAIVGPNGSGKSNVVEAIRWVLGEQSFKSLRGRRGEDLIFNGSVSSPRLSRASVTAVFDNSKKHFPVEFGEVAIGRRVYRDGKGEYALNESDVRLKDVIELLAHVGLGVSQHPIISQGEADRVLHVSPKERQGMIEEALGLKIYQYRREEAERKLVETEQNIRQAQALRAEVKPHLDHLKRLVEKYERASEIKTTLAETAAAYLAGFLSDLRRERERLQEGREAEDERKKIEEQLVRMRKNEAMQAADALRTDRLRRTEHELSVLRKRRAECERELGRAEGLLEASTLASGTEDDAIPREEVEGLLMRAEDDLGSVLEMDSVAEIHEAVETLLDRLSTFLTGARDRQTESADTATHQKRVAEWKTALADSEKKEALIATRLEDEWAAIRETDHLCTETAGEITAFEARARSLDDQIRQYALASETQKMREAEWEREREDIRHILGDVAFLDTADPLGSDEREKIRKSLERLKFRLEEAGGVDAAVLREYEDAKARDRFFEKELADLVGSAKELRGVSKELLQKIEGDFSRGIEKINAEFNRFFQTMFGGGTAKLAVAKERRPIVDDETPPEESGVHIDVSLPRKKIRGLDMLSGGERSLTAVALLFALASVSPPPFLVLDETDAALDEANSLRYGDMLKELSRSTQIITVTHNRQTMRRAGILYGITAGSDGISRLLSLRLAEAEEMVPAN